MEKKEEKDEANYNFKKKNAPKVINLQNGRSFTSKWERISRKQLPINIKVQRQRSIGPRKNNRMIYLNLTALGFRKIKKKRKEQILNRLNPIYNRVNQSGKGIGRNLIKAGFDLGSKAIGSEFGKKINKGIDNIPNIFKFRESKIKNKNVKKILSSDIADMAVDETQNRAKNKYKTLFE